MTSTSPQSNAVEQDVGPAEATAARFEEHARAIHVRTDRMFAVLMLLQWVAGIIAAVVITPRTWIGAESVMHPHVYFAVLVGGAIAVPPIVLAIWWPGRLLTRLVVASSQMLFSSLLIHLCGGRIETHFHVFGSLAFLAAYRDWRVLVPATIIVAIDHLAGGVWWPESVFGVATAGHWRWLEHSSWVLFEDFFLLIIIHQSVREMHQLAEHTTSLEAAKQDAQKSERRFRASFDQAAVGMCHCSPNGKLLRVNGRFCEIVGYTREELCQRHFKEITHPEDIEGSLEVMQQVLSGDATGLVVEKRYLHKQGHEVWVNKTLAAVRGNDGQVEYLVAIIEDVSEAVLAKRQLLKSHKEIEKLSLVASKTRNSVIISDAQGRIEWANVAFTELTEYPLEEVVGRKPGDLLQGPKTDRETVRRVGELVRTGKSVTAELINYSKSGREYWIALEVDPVRNEAGELTNFIATQVEITERKRNERILREAKEQAEAANQAKSQFLANMSHEIRTPLNAILGFTEILQRDDDGFNMERIDYLSTINSSGRHLLDLINDVLDLSKIEAGQLQVERISCSPHQIIAEIVSALRVRAQENCLSLEYEWRTGVPEKICTDPHRLKQLLMNLVGNAIKFTEQGSVSIAASYVSAAGGATLEIAVKDTGTGISPEKLEDIFDPFVQADNSVTRRFGGTGLGLAISRNIAEALGGSIRVESQLGKGSLFTLSIDCGDPSEITIHSTPEEYRPTGDVPGQEPYSTDLTGVHILVADDGITNRRLVELLLSRQGAEVTVAENGEIALRRIEERDYDLVLMDMQMPVMDGYTAVTRLRDQGETMPVIALTAHALKGDRERCLEVGCTDYLPKPINSNALIRKVVQGARIADRIVQRRSAVQVEEKQTGGQAIYSTLPTDDLEIYQVVCEFVEGLPDRITAMGIAARAGDFDKLAFEAHALKGAGGTAGFSDITEPAQRIETLAKQNRTEETLETIEQLSAIIERISMDA